LHIDWRTVPQRGVEDVRSAVAHVLDTALVDGATGDVHLNELRLRTYTGQVREVPAAFPSFVLAEDDPMLGLAQSALEAAFRHPVPVGRWSLATDGGHLFATGIRCVGFGPGDERLAHTNREHVPVSDLPEAALGNAALALALTAADEAS
jgi:acetylornithine deacetylase/succinyl-diaminopimelate desuccinylase-like protein